MPAALQVGAFVAQASISPSFKGYKTLLEKANKSGITNHKV
jgi:hypothetical protein